MVHMLGVRVIRSEWNEMVTLMFILGEWARL